MAEKIEFRQFLDDIAQVADGDFATGFKMLGFVVFVSKHGAEDLLSGSMVSPRTYYRWIETVKAAGWQDLLADVRLTQALREYAGDITAQPAEVRNTVLHRLNEVLNSGSSDSFRPLKPASAGTGRQQHTSTAMPGLDRHESREPEPSALQHLRHRRHLCLLSDNDLAERIRSLGNAKTVSVGVDHRELAKGIPALTQQASG